ncbi:MAG: LssY C-terminal domain-containing protein [Desulfobacterales bacterium]|nr:MAG: LssY C-terminal domain-containing protein [Desulfobacterales bacterium]
MQSRAKSLVMARRQKVAQHFSGASFTPARAGHSDPAIPLIRLWIIAACLFALVFGGCATTGTSTSFKPSSINDVRFRDRAQSKQDDELRVTVAVPTAEEARALFGADLSVKEIQPIWLKVENHSDKTYYLLSVAVDPNYFSPLEAAFAVHGGLSQSARNEMETYFRSMNFRNPILPNTAVSGFIFANLDEGEKLVQVDLIADQQIKFFTFFVQIPGMRVDYRMVDFDKLYSNEEIVELDQDELREALEKLPCCTTNKEQTAFGDPLNLVIIGNFIDVASAFARRGWLPAEETYSTAVWKTIKSFLFGKRYRYSPVSSLYAYGRHQDFARQKPRHDIHERNHLRLWYSPMRFEGKPVFIGQISRDIGVRFTSKTWPPVTHKIDPDIDEARHALVEDLIFSQTVAKVGWVKGVGPARPSKPRTNLTGDPYFTDGNRVVLILDQGPIALNEIETLDWENPETFHLGL